MGAIADFDDLVAKSTGGNSGTPERIWFHRWDRIAGTAITFLQNRYYSLWGFDGQPSAGVAPGAVAAPDATTAGGLKQANPGGGRQKWITSFGNFMSTGQGSLLLYDRLLHVSGLSGTVTTAQSVGGAITRYTGAEAYNNQVWYEVYSAVGATTTTISMNYTDQNGNAKASPATTFGGVNFGPQARCQPMNLASGDTGARGVTDVTLAATTGTAGDFGITIARPLLELNITMVGGGGCLTFFENIAEVKTDACLAMIWTPHSISRLGLGGWVGMVEA